MKSTPGVCRFKFPVTFTGKLAVATLYKYLMGGISALNHCYGLGVLKSVLCLFTSKTILIGPSESFVFSKYFAEARLGLSAVKK